MKDGLYRIEVRAETNELENGGHVMIMGDGGFVFAEIHPVKIRATPKTEKPIVGGDGTIYTQDPNKQGWTGAPAGAGRSDLDYIRSRLSQAELLAQLAEEATELAHAALKLRRVYDGTNPTPVKRSEAFENLKEEIADVELLLTILQLGTSTNFQEYSKAMDAKLWRWVYRLQEQERNDTE